MIQKEQEVDHHRYFDHHCHHHPYHDQVRQHVEEKVLALQMSLRELQTGVEGLGPLQTGELVNTDELLCKNFTLFMTFTVKGCPSCERVWARCTRRWRQKSTNNHRIWHRNQDCIWNCHQNRIRHRHQSDANAQTVVILCGQASVTQQKSRMAEMEELLKSEMTNIKGERCEQFLKWQKVNSLSETSLSLL